MSIAGLRFASVAHDNLNVYVILLSHFLVWDGGAAYSFSPQGVVAGMGDGIKGMGMIEQLEPIHRTSSVYTLRIFLSSACTQPHLA